MKVLKIINNENDYIVCKTSMYKKNKISLEDQIRIQIDCNKLYGDFINDNDYKLEIDNNDYNNDDLINKITEIIDNDKCKNVKSVGVYSILAQQYTIANPLRLNYLKSYYSENKDKIREKVAEKKCCEICDRFITKSNFTKHLKSQKHLLKLHKLNNQ